MSRPKFSPNAFSATAFGVAQPPNGIAAYASMLQVLFPPGRVWRWLSSVLSNLIEGCAVELARLDERMADLLDESDPRTAIELLPEYERELDVAGATSIAERQARVVARLLARQGVRPVDFQTSLAPLLGLDPGDVVVIERSRAQVIALGDDREIYRFFIYRNPALPGTAFIASAQAQCTAMAPLHTLGFVIESIAMLVDDPHSLVDRDLLGS